MTDLPTHAISLIQPWAWLMLELPPSQRKDVENRKWSWTEPGTKQVQFAVVALLTFWFVGRIDYTNLLRGTNRFWRNPIGEQQPGAPAPRSEILNVHATLHLNASGNCAGAFRNRE